MENIERKVYKQYYFTLLVPRKKKSLMHYLGYLVAALLVAGIGYSVYYFLSGTENTEEYDVCVDDRCIRAFHAHMQLSVELCGEKTLLPLERGPLDGPHTHKERNLIHFEERLPYEKETGRLLDTTPFRMETIMDIFEIPFTADCLGEYCSGDFCPDGTPGVVTMTVNGEQRTDFEQYVWKDDDYVELRFG